MVDSISSGVSTFLQPVGPATQLNQINAQKAEIDLQVDRIENSDEDGGVQVERLSTQEAGLNIDPNVPGQRLDISV